MTPKRRVSATSVYFESMPYRLDESTGLVDYDALAVLICCHTSERHCSPQSNFLLLAIPKPSQEHPRYPWGCPADAELRPVWNVKIVTLSCAFLLLFLSCRLLIRAGTLCFSRLVPHHGNRIVCRRLPSCLGQK